MKKFLSQLSSLYWWICTYSLAMTMLDYPGLWDPVHPITMLIYCMFGFCIGYLAYDEQVEITRLRQSILIIIVASLASVVFVGKSGCGLLEGLILVFVMCVPLFLLSNED